MLKVDIRIDTSALAKALEDASRAVFWRRRSSAKAKLRAAFAELWKATGQAGRRLRDVMDPRFDDAYGFICVWCGRTTVEGMRFTSDCCYHAATGLRSC